MVASPSPGSNTLSDELPERVSFPVVEPEIKLAGKAVSRLIEASLKLNVSTLVM